MTYSPNVNLFFYDVLTRHLIKYPMSSAGYSLLNYILGLGIHFSVRIMEMYLRALVYLHFAE